METPAAVVFLSFAVTTLLGRLLLFWAPKWGLMDAPGERKPHAVGTPLGGMALVAGSTLAIILFIPGGLHLWGWLFGALAVALLGLWDDRRQLGPVIRLIGQALAALFPILLGGFLIQSVNLFGWIIPLGSLAIPLTLLWIVGITNAFNLIDGLDGLATGALLVLSTATAILSVKLGNGPTLLISAALFGSGVAFLLYNLHPARLFLGDGGSYYLGFTLAMLAISSLKQPELPLHGVPVLIPVILLLYPLLDTLWAILRRVMARRSIFQADQQHLHHTLLNRAGSYARAISWLYAIFILLGIASVVLFMISR